jgi:hypothetical protein
VEGRAGRGAPSLGCIAAASNHAKSRAAAGLGLIQLNQEVRREALDVYDERIGKAEVSEPFATLANPKLPAALDGKVLTGSSASSKGLLVGLTGRHLNQGVRQMIRNLHREMCSV